LSNEQHDKGIEADEPDPRSEALYLASMEVPVFPVWGVVIGSDGTAACQCPMGKACGDAGKHPIYKGGCNDASTDKERVGRLWDSSPGPNYGVALGGDSGLVVIDVDCNKVTKKGVKVDGFAELAKLEAELGPLPVTATAESGSGGEHRYYLHPSPWSSSPSQIRGIVGLDVKGKGGYVVGPGCRHWSGGAYRWKPGRHPEDVGFAKLPPQWAELVVRKGQVRESAEADRQPVDAYVPETETVIQQTGTVIQKIQTVNVSHPPKSAGWSIRDAIEYTRPRFIGQRNAKLGKFAAIVKYKLHGGKEIPEGLARSYVKAWTEAAAPYVSGDTDEDGNFRSFVGYYKTAQRPPQHWAFADANRGRPWDYMAKAIKSKAIKARSIKDVRQRHLLAGLLKLQRMVGCGTFFLATWEAAELVGAASQTTHRWLEYFRNDGILVRDKTGERRRGGGRASEYHIDWESKALLDMGVTRDADPPPVVAEPTQKVAFSDHDRQCEAASVVEPTEALC